MIPLFLQKKALQLVAWLVYLAIVSFIGSKAEGATVHHLDSSGWQAPVTEVSVDPADSVCLVRTADGSAGSGSLVEVSGRLFVLTNFHVVRNDNSGQPHRSASVTFTRLGVSQQLELVATDEDSDVVALDGEPLRGQVPPLWIADQSAYEQGETGSANVYGHPLAGAMRGRSTQYWQGDSIYAMDESGQRVPAVFYQGGAISGESGGPLVAEGSRVVAICWGSDYEGRGHAVPLPRIQNLIRRVFQAQCTGPNCIVQRPGGQVIISQPPQQQPRAPQVWVNPQFGPPVQEPGGGQQPELTPVNGEPAGDNRGPLMVAGAGVASFLYNFRKRL